MEIDRLLKNWKGDLWLLLQGQEGRIRKKEAAEASGDGSGFPELFLEEVWKTCPSFWRPGCGFDFETQAGRKFSSCGRNNVIAKGRKFLPGSLFSPFRGRNNCR